MPKLCSGFRAVKSARPRLVEAWIASAWTDQVDSEHQLGTLPLADRAVTLRLLDHFPSMIHSLRSLDPNHDNADGNLHYSALAWLPNRWHMNYFHWTVDLLPSLVEAYKFCSLIDAQLSVVTPSRTDLDRRPYIAEWLDLLDQGFGEATKVAIEHHSFHKTPTLHLATGRIRKLRSGRVAVGITSQLIQSLKQFKSCGTQTTNVSSRKILILRGVGASRRSKSDLRIENVLAERGFEPIDFSTMSVRSQLSALESCDEVVGIHGAALTNLIWSSRCTVSEIIDIRHSCLHRRSEFYEISRLVGNQHTFQFRNKIENQK